MGTSKLFHILSLNETHLSAYKEADIEILGWTSWENKEFLAKEIEYEAISHNQCLIKDSWILRKIISSEYEMKFDFLKEKDFL